MRSSTPDDNINQCREDQSIKNNTGQGNNAADPVIGASSLMIMANDNTIKHSNLNESLGSPSPAATVVELSSLFQYESSLFRDENRHATVTDLLVKREAKRRNKLVLNSSNEFSEDEDGSKGEGDELPNNDKVTRGKRTRRKNKSRGITRQCSCNNADQCCSEDDSSIEMSTLAALPKISSTTSETQRKCSSDQLISSISPPDTSSLATLSVSNISHIINAATSTRTTTNTQNQQKKSRQQGRRKSNIWNNIRGSFSNKRSNQNGGDESQKTAYNSITGGGGSGLDNSLSSFSLGSIREEDGSDEENEDPLMEVMDYLEDEIDEHTYDDLIPLQIRMALEDQVFGWDHFFSNILGHVGFTVGSYLLTFWIITFVVLREVPWKHFEHDDVESNVRTNNPWGMPHELFSFIRTALSLGSAISTFRTIRRRRRVWLRQPFGDTQHTAGSREFQRHQSSLEEADRRAQRFVLGSKLWAKMQRSYTKRRNKYLARGVHRKLLKAQKMFERRHRNRVKLIRSTSASSLINSISSSVLGSNKNRAVASALTRDGHESSHHERVRMLAGASPIATRKRMDSTDISVGDDSTAGSVGGSSVGDNTPDYYQHYLPPGQYAMDSHTLPNFAMESVSHDQMPFAHGEIKKVPYVHGGFFGAAPFMLTNPHWIAILRILMPDVYVEISRRAAYAPAPRLIHWAENNPVVAAYGTAHEIEYSGKVPTLEWDVFLDPYLVRRVEIVLSEKEAFIGRQIDARKKARESKGTENNDGDNLANEKDEQSSTNVIPISAADERLVLSYYDKEIKRRTTILTERMLIAHGNIMQLVSEHFFTSSYLKKYNFSRVKRTRKTLGGGIFARQWLDVYSEAMKLGMGYDEDEQYVDDSDSGTDCTDGSIDELNFVHFSGADVSPNDPREVISPDAKYAPRHSSSCRTPPGGPPRKIIMMRTNSNDSGSDEGMSTDGDASIHSESSPGKVSAARSSRSSAPRRRRQQLRADAAEASGGRSRTSTPASTYEPPAGAITHLHMASIVPDKSMAESISLLKPIMQCSAPFGLVLDMKSRHVSRRVWAAVIDYLRDCGARIEGIASFIVEEVRDISQYCSSSVNEILFIHSAGDLQAGCHSGQIRRGDKVFFNAGSLLWDYPNVYCADTIKNIFWHRFQPCFDEQGIKLGYRLKPYAKVVKSPTSRRNIKSHQPYSESESEACDESTLDDGESTDTLFARLLIADTKKKSMSEMEFVYEEAPDGICSTIQQYKEHYQLSIGLYVQEFAIDEVAISLIVKYANSNLHVYDLGLSWGGVNGLTVKGIQPGRFTATDGLWNQRYGGMPWKKDLNPGDFVPNMGID